MTARISLTMIVKNEDATLGRCLASVRDLVEKKKEEKGVRNRF